jgi:hypothetical protein
MYLHHCTRAVGSFSNLPLPHRLLAGAGLPPLPRTFSSTAAVMSGGIGGTLSLAPSLRYRGKTQVSALSVKVSLTGVSCDFLSDGCLLFCSLSQACLRGDFKSR